MSIFPYLNDGNVQFTIQGQAHDIFPYLETELPTDRRTQGRTERTVILIIWTPQEYKTQEPSKDFITLHTNAFFALF